MEEIKKKAIVNVGLYGDVDNEKIEEMSKQIHERFGDVEVFVYDVDDKSKQGVTWSQPEEPITVLVKKLDERAELPKKAFDGDMCYDIKAISMEYDEKQDTYVYHTGLAMESPKKTGCLAFVRSSNGRTDAYLVNHVGVLDTEIYRGEFILKYKNRTAYRVNCLMDEFDYMRMITEGANFDDEANVGEAVASMKERAKTPYKQKSPIEYAPYKVGERIAQIMFIHIPEVNFKLTDKLSDSERSDGGFGHTGK